MSGDADAAFLAEVDAICRKLGLLDEDIVRCAAKRSELKMLNNIEGRKRNGQKHVAASTQAFPPRFLAFCDSYIAAVARDEEQQDDRAARAADIHGFLQDALVGENLGVLSSSSENSCSTNFWYSKSL